MLKALPRLLLGIAAILAVIALAFLVYPPALQSAYALLQQDNNPRPPVTIARGVHWVGASDVASYLIETEHGVILIDGGYASTAPQIIANIEALGFEMSDVRFILNTHAHFDHAAGLAALSAASGAPVYASAADAVQLRQGGANDFYLRNFWRYPPVEVERELIDGEQVTLGGVTLTAHLTPGHTKGCTSWTFPVTMHDGRVAQALIICSLSTLTFDLVDNPDYPEIAADFARTYDTLQSLPCEVFLGAHGNWFDIEGKRARIANGELDAFYDPNGCRAYLAQSRAEFEAALARQQN
ncbi:MAG: subclass B3 metallo-beta-lactamase [Hyphomonadaceae bacterium]|nr:subclass B3 metallo-beta-lactamase [Hyphomonadaceae bacterium]